ncbi:MAG: hypothetical protein JRN35_06165 [Nitrososphaerota archaeon]|nr:hypothetical protein [Nitrososphaerota archaeon]
MSESDKILRDILTRVRDEHGIDLSLPAPRWRRFPDGFSWRFFGKLQLRRGVKAYCWSTTRNANGKFLSWVYQPRVGRGIWDFTHVREHVKRTDAKARALHLFREG